MKWWALSCLLLICCCGLIIVNAGMFAYPLESTYSDLLISHYPNAVYVNRSIAQWGTIPLWSNTILSGYPFAANPLSGLWYIPGWIVFIAPGPVLFNLTVVLHLIFGGLGMLAWQKRRGIGWVGAIISAISFIAMPKLMAHFAAGHISMVYSVCWTPWLLWSVHKYHDQSPRNKNYWITGGVLGAMILADVRWAAYAGLMMGVYELGLALIQIRAKRIPGLIKRSTHALLAAILGTIISAPLLLLLIEYTSLSSRALLTASESFAFSLPAEKILGALIPDFLGYAEWVMYPGALGFLCLVYCLAIKDLRKICWPWVVFALVCVIYALGSSIPGLSELSRLPGWGLLRVPSRALFGWGIALAIISGQVVDWLLTFSERPKFDPFFFITPILAFTILLALGVRYIEGKWLLNFLWGAIAVSLFGASIFIQERRWLKSTIWSGLVILLILVDLNGVNLQSVQYKTKNEAISEGQEVVQFIATRAGDRLYRVYSPSYSIPQQNGAVNGIELADGIDPMQLMSYVNYMENASGVPQDGYSVTLPPYKNGDPVTANTDFIPDAAALGLLNVKFVAAEYPVHAQGLNLLDRINGTYIYENSYEMPRAWVEGANKSVSNVNILEWGPNRIRVLSEQGGELILSELNYPGWQVFIDGEKVQPIPDKLLRTVNIPEGKHEILFKFQPWQIPTAAGIQLVCLVGWLWLTSRNARLLRGKP